MSYVTGSASITSTAVTVIASVPPSNESLLLRTASSTTVYIGGSAVSSTTGFGISSSDGIVRVPTIGDDNESLYGTLASGGPVTVTYISAQ
jgi:hypothetical protein